MDTINSSSLPFDPFAVPYGAADSTYAADFSPISLFSPLEDFGADLTSDSAGSPSPVSPGLSASSYGFPPTDDWTHWDSIEHSPEPDALFKPEPFVDGLLLSSIPPKGSTTPAINPMALTMPSASPFTYSPQAPLFQQQQPAQVNMVRVPPTVPSNSLSAKQQEDPTKRYPTRNLKRKSSTSSVSDDDEEPAPKRTSPSPSPARRASATSAAPKKTAHNMIEKRYRTNLNDKIAQLRDAVPALRVVAQRLEGGAEDDGQEGAGGFLDDEFSSLAPVAKLNKATILSKATEYIAQLERRNRNLETENGALRGRMEGLEMLLIGRQGAAGSVGAWN